MSQKKLVLLGAGWLGKSFAEMFAKKGAVVFAGSRKIKEIETENEVNYFPLQFDGDWHFQLSEEEIQQTDWLVIMLPPTHFDDYAAALVNAVQLFPKTTSILFTSSTSVYAEMEGVVDESSPLNTEHAVSKAETQLVQLFGQRLTILRLAGLIGTNRHPSKFFVKKGIINDGLAPVNLVRREDVIQACIAVIEANRVGEIFNICSPQHPSRGDYYREAASNLFGVTIPSDQKGCGKTVDGSRIESELRFNYAFKIDEWPIFR